MSLPDGAEYWWDVKDTSHNYTGKVFTHIPNADCGHKHWIEAKKLGNVDCYACLELIKKGYPHGLEEGIYLTHSQREIKAKGERQKAFDEKNGICNCGRRWVVRKNKINGNEFLGCCTFPKCKNTKTI